MAQGNGAGLSTAAGSEGFKFDSRTFSTQKSSPIIISELEEYLESIGEEIR